MSFKQMMTGTMLMVVLFSIVVFATSSVGATEVETASNAVENVEKSAVESGSSSAGPPFPRIYMMVHGELPDGGSPDGVMCSLPLETADSWDTLAALANIIEMPLEFGDKRKVDLNGDGDCLDETIDMAMIPWLEGKSNELPANYWGVTIPRKQLAFGSGWYYHDHDNPPGDWREQQALKVKNECVQEWPLRDTAGNISHWGPSLLGLPLAGLNVMTYPVSSATGEDNTCGTNPNLELYVDWWPNWIHN